MNGMMPTPEDMSMDFTEPSGPPSLPMTPETFAPGAVPVPVITQQPSRGSGSKVVFEDLFPPLDLTEGERKSIGAWFRKDLAACVRNVNAKLEQWEKFRAVFMLEYFQRCYPSMDLGAEFHSGVLCEKVLDAVHRMKKSIFTPRPLFVVDDQITSGMKMEQIHRMEWFLHTILMRDVKIREAVGWEALFDFILDGSLVIDSELDYEQVLTRTIRTFNPGEEEGLLAVEDRILDPSALQEAMAKLSSGQAARVVVEEEEIVKEGLQLFRTDKKDHLIPPGVYRDSDVRFRGRRLYLTRADIELLGSKDVGWYDEAAAKAVIDGRSELQSLHRASNSPNLAEADRAREQLSQRSETELLSFPFNSTSDSLGTGDMNLPYDSMFAVYRVHCKYGYKTKADPKGLIPKWCVIDWEPDSDTVLRARVYPHFHESKPYFHFKMAHVPDSYYGFGFGARLTDEDQLESNAVNLFLEGSALATIKAFLCVSPEHDGILPFPNGLAPGKVGYVRQISDFQEIPFTAPPAALLNVLLPIVQRRAENRTGITALVQGRTESADPRSPASKAQMLLGQAYISIESIIDDWNLTGWEPMANFVWWAAYENAVYKGKDTIANIGFVGMAPDLEKTNDISLVELGTRVQWVSQAAAAFISSDVRETTFLRHFQFFFPMLLQIAKINPEVFRKYFVRWMHWAATELEMRGHKFLLPSEEELAAMPPEQVATLGQGMLTSLKGGASAQNALTGAPETGGGTE